MKGKNLKKIVFLTYLYVQISFGRTEVCPSITPVNIDPKVQVSVSFEKKSGNYTYLYALSNSVQAKAPIWRFSIESYTAPLSVNAGKGWDTQGFRPRFSEIEWSESSITNPIKPGDTAQGFKIVSKKGPGLVQFFAGGHSELPTIKFETDAEAEEGDHETITCPGFFRGSSIHDGQVVTVAKGPQIDNRTEVSIRIKKASDKSWFGNPNTDPEDEISPLHDGKIQVIVFGDKTIDVQQIKIDSLEFGKGKAKPIKSEVVMGVTGNVDKDGTKIFKNSGSKNLLLEFNSASIDIKCDIDRALFLKGKIGAKDLFGAVKIKHVSCDKKTFAKEAKKQLENVYSH